MQRLIGTIFLLVLFSSCLDENKFDMLDMGGITTNDFIYDDPDKYILSQNRLHAMFAETMDFKVLEMGLLMNEFEA